MPVVAVGPHIQNRVNVRQLPGVPVELEGPGGVHEFLVQRVVRVRAYKKFSIKKLQNYGRDGLVGKVENRTVNA